MNQQNIYSNIDYTSAKPIVSVLLESPISKEIRIIMSESSIMKEHKTPYPIIIQVIEGEIEFGFNNQLSQLIKGDIISLDGNIPHDLKALSNSIIRLTLLKNDSVERVNKVATEM